MRFSAIFPALCAFISMVLGFLCIFAGTKPGYLEDYAIVTLNVSRIGVDLFETSTTSSGSPDGGSILGNLKDDISDAANSIEAKIEDEINDSLESVARQLGLHDFYSWHVLDYCQGYYMPNETNNGHGAKSDDNPPPKQHKSVTYCSPQQSFFEFHPKDHLQHELNNASDGLHLNLDMDLHWPSAVTELLDSISMGIRVMFVLYVLAITACAICLVFSVAGIFVFMYSKPFCLGLMAMSQFAFFVFMVASAIVTGSGRKVQNVVNQYGKDINIDAYAGEKIVNITWAATLLMFFAGVVWGVEWFLLKKKDKRLSEKVQG